jgi:hypothetical protein
LSISRVTSGGLGDFTINLIGEVIELALSAAESRGVIAQYAPGRAFDALFQLFDALTRVPRCLGGIFLDPKVDELFGNLERVGDFLLGRLPDGVVKLFGQERLGFLGVWHGAAHLLEELIEPFFLLFQTLADLLAFTGIAE